MALSLAAVTFSIIAFRSSERAEGPIVAVGGHHWIEIRTTTRVGNVTRHSDQLNFGVLVLVNRGRTPLDLVDVRPVNNLDEPQPGKVIFSAQYCENRGHATIAPGSGLAVAILGSSTKGFSGAWQAVFATGTKTVRLELDRSLANGDPADVGKSYDADAENLIRTCGLA